MKERCMIAFIFCIICSFTAAAQSSQNNAAGRMNAFIDGLMKKMTLEEKIGQLNLLTPGGAVTGSVVSSDVDAKIRKGQVGGLFGITGPEKIRRAQEIAVKNSSSPPKGERTEVRWTSEEHIKLSNQTERAFAWLRSQCPLNPDLEKHLVGYAKLTGME